MTVKQDIPAQVIHEIDKVADEILNGLGSIDEKKINLVPFEGSWTAAQVIVHVTKSNNGLIRYFQETGTIPSREPDSGVETLKKIFLDFATKLKSPDFIVPEALKYNKHEIVSKLRQSFEDVLSAARECNLTDEVNHFIFKSITKVELAHFIVYHTQRHIHQLKKIKKALE